MSNIKQLKANNSNIYPITHEDAVLDENGTAISEKYATKEYTNSQISALNGQIDTLSSSLSEIQSSSEQVNNIAGDLSQLQTSNKSNLVSAINEAFQYGNSVKQSLVDALIAKDVSNISTSTSMSQLIAKIGDIEQGGSNIFEVTGLPAWYNGGSIDLSNTWVTGTSSTKLHGHGAGIIGDKIYVCGGLSSTSTANASNYQKASYYYNIKTNGWGTNSNMEVAKYEHACVVANNKMYAIAGFSNRTTRTNTVFCFDPLLGTWTTETAIYAGGTSYGMAAAAIGNTIYVCGGNTGSAQTYNGSYDTQTKSWTTKTAMPEARYNHAATSYRNYIYVMGGYKANTNYIYNPSINQWTTLTTTPEYVQHHTLSVIKDKVYLVGGQTGTNTNTASSNVQCYNPDTGSWETKKASLPKAIYSHAAVVYKNNIYVIGGRSSSVFDTTYCYIPE
jgi:hypothetical protein